MSKNNTKAAAKKKDVVVGFDVALKALISSLVVVLLVVAALLLTNIFAYGVFIIAIVCIAMSVYGTANGASSIKTYISNEKNFNPTSTLNVGFAAVVIGALGMFFEFGFLTLVFLGPETIWFSALFYIIAVGGLIIAAYAMIKSFIGIAECKNNGIPATHGMKATAALGITVVALIILFFIVMLVLRSVVGYDLSIIK